MTPQNKRRVVDVEPLSDARWGRIERGLFDQLDREKVIEAPTSAPHAWRWRSAAALIVAGAAAAAIGAVATRSLWSERPIAAPSRIVTGGSGSHVVLGEASLDVGADSALLVSGDDDHGVLIVLDQGSVECEVAPRKARPPFIVQAGDTRVRVVGTHFTVSRPEGGTRVQVSKGVVEVSVRGESVNVGAGETWPAASAEPRTGEPKSEGSAEHAAESPAESRPRGVAASGNRDRGGAKRNSGRPPVGRTAPSTEPPVTPAPTADEAPPAPPQVAPAPPVPPSPQERYETAARLEKTDPNGALGVYRSVAAGAGPWAANALYAAGRLQADRGQRADAERLLRDYLARFPRGPNANDARDLLDRMR